METEQNKITLLDYLQIVVKWRRVIVGFVLISCLLAAVLSFLLPETYRGRATLLPPERQTPVSGFTSLLQGVNVPQGLGLPQLSNTSDLFVEILKSRYVTSRIVERFKLTEYYEVAHPQFAENRLVGSTSINASRNGVITIQTEAATPELAAALTNAFVEELDRFNRENSMSSAKNTRIFIEQRLDEARRELELALAALQKFQEKYHLISLTDQAKMMVEIAADVESQIRLLEFERSVKRATLSPTHPDIKQVELQLSELRKQLSRLKSGDQNPQNIETDREGFNIPFNRMPDLQRQLGQLMLESKIQQSIVEILFQQYEQAKVQEVRNTPTVRLLDEATPPVMRNYPRRKEMVIISGVVGMFLSLLMVFILEYRQTVNHSPETLEKVSRIRDMMKSDFEWFGVFFKGKSKGDR